MTNDMYPLVLGMFRNGPKGAEDTKYIVFSDDGETVKELRRFESRSNALFFLQTHPLPIGSFCRWLWGI